MGENLYGKGQRVLSRQGWDNWDRTFGKKENTSKDEEGNRTEAPVEETGGTKTSET